MDPEILGKSTLPSLASYLDTSIDLSKYLISRQFEPNTGVSALLLISIPELLICKDVAN